MKTLASRTAVITGASSGIGLATALEFAAKGYNVVVAARRIKELESVATECKTYGVGALAVALDTADEQAMHQLGQIAKQTFGRVNVWVNNAGVYLTGKFQDLPLADMRRLMDTNFFGYVHGSLEALALFREQGFGTLINVSSINATAPLPYVSIYNASMAAIRSLDESLRMELRLEGLHDRMHICTVMPASVDTNLYQNSGNYSGRRVRAVEPVYDPEYVAKHIAALADKPKREIKVGPIGRLLALENAHMPRRFERALGRFTESNLLDQEQPAGDTPGALYTSIDMNRGMRGGWRESRVRADRMNVTMGVTAAAIAGAVGMGYWLLRRRPGAS